MNNTLPLTGGECHQARSFLSLAPLIDFWKTGLIPRYPRMAPIFDEIMVQLPEALRGIYRTTLIWRNIRMRFMH